MARALLALTAAAAALRFATLDLQSFWFDEAVTVRLVRDDLFGMLGNIPDSESSPPLYYIVAWLWSKVFGTGEAGLRSLSAVAGTALVPVAYAAAAQLAERRAALGVAALAAFSPLLVWYSQEARAYSLLALLLAAGLLGFARELREHDGRSLALWAAASALALATHYFAVFLVAPQAIWLLARRRGPGTGRAVGAVAATAAALVPLAIHQRGLDLASFIREDALGYRITQAGKQLVLGFDAPLEVAATLLAGLIVLAGLALAARTIATERPAGLTAAAALAAIGIVVPLLLALVGSDYFVTRNLIGVWLPLMTVSAAGLVAVWAGPAAIGVLCAIGLLAVIGTDLEPRWQRENWRDIARELGPARYPRAIVVSPGATGEAPLRLYLPGARRLADDASAEIREIALVSTPDPDPHEVHPGPPPRPARAGLDLFPEVRRVEAEDYTLIVLRANAARLQPRAGLAGVRLLKGERAEVLVQSP